MIEPRQCAQCGAELAEDAPGGLCATCTSKSPPEGRPPDNLAETAPFGSRFSAPKPEELARYFPQLEIIELLGQGGMGAVYKARQPTLDRLVAVKILPAEVAGDPGFAERFTREARALARLNHPNIVGIYDFGQADGLYYFVMEYVEGASLRQLVAKRELTPRQALALVPQICEALQFAHDEEIVHRDIKPENILIDKRGRVKVADFGLAKLLGCSADEATLTRVEQVMGTPLYMAPEQMQSSHAVDHRADIYSLGVVFYEMLTGELPLGRFAPPSQKVEVDVRLDEVVLRALEREPDRRYQHASDVKSDVESIASPPARKAAAAARENATNVGVVEDDAFYERFKAAAARADAVNVCASSVRRAAIGLFLSGIPSLALFLMVSVPECFQHGGFASPSELLRSQCLVTWSVLTILTSWRMYRFQAYALALSMSVLAIVIGLPLITTGPLLILTLPMGVWALVVLLRHDVRDAFASARTVQTTGLKAVAAQMVTLLTAWACLLGLGSAFVPWAGFSKSYSKTVPGYDAHWDFAANVMGFDWSQGMFAAAVFTIIVCILVATPVHVPRWRPVAVVACALAVAAAAAHFWHECGNGDLPVGPLVRAARMTSLRMNGATEIDQQTPKTLQVKDIVATRRTGPHLAMFVAVAVLMLTALQSAFAQWDRNQNVDAAPHAR